MSIRGAAELLKRPDHALWILTTAEDTERAGILLSTVCSASIAPDTPRVTFGIARQHHTFALFSRTRQATLHLLAADQAPLAWRFGTTSGFQTDKFSGIAVESSLLGNPLLPDTAGYFDCRIEAELDVGDRVLFLAEVVDGRDDSDREMLTIGNFIRSGSDEQLQALRVQLERDALIEGDAIRAWRAGHGNAG